MRKGARQMTKEEEHKRIRIIENKIKGFGMSLLSVKFSLYTLNKIIKSLEKQEGK